MSLILDALNKADRDRDYSDGVPDLKTLHHGVMHNGRSDRRLLILGALVVVLLVAIAMLLFIWLRSSVSAAPEASTVAIHQTAAPSSDSMANPSVPTTPGEIRTGHVAQRGITESSTAESDTVVTRPKLVTDSPEGAEVDPEVQALYQVQYGEVQVIEPTVQPASSELQTRQTSVDEGLARALWEQSRTQPLPQAPLTEQVITPAPVNAEPESDVAVDADFESTIAAFDDVPFLHELPVALQNRIPTLMYAQHSFDAQSVTINKKTFTVGDNIGNSVVVERILADGVLLNYEGEQFKLAALSSWVNY